MSEFHAGQRVMVGDHLTAYKGVSGEVVAVRGLMGSEPNISVLLDGYDIPHPFIASELIPIDSVSEEHGNDDSRVAALSALHSAALAQNEALTGFIHDWLGKMGVPEEENSELLGIAERCGLLRKKHNDLKTQVASLTKERTNLLLIVKPLEALWHRYVTATIEDYATDDLFLDWLGEDTNLDDVFNALQGIVKQNDMPNE